MLRSMDKGIIAWHDENINIISSVKKYREFIQKNPDEHTFLIVADSAVYYDDDVSVFDSDGFVSIVGKDRTETAEWVAIIYNNHFNVIEGTGSLDARVAPVAEAWRCTRSFSDSRTPSIRLFSTDRMTSS